jgi:gamma-glutamyltranspeptidase/glutathione hydrolase
MNTKRLAGYLAVPLLILAAFFPAVLPTLTTEGASPQPVRAKHGMVVSVEENASRAGTETLRHGGNAIDAAVATGLALAVTHPTAGNLGGGGFMLIRFADGRATFIDFRERAPAAASRNMYLDDKGNPTNGSTVGPRASGIPGSVAGFEYARAKYGKKKWADLVAPAEKLAKKGFALNYETARSLAGARSLARFPESKRVFQRDGHFYETGDVFVQKDLAHTLHVLRKKGARDFYEGEIARKLDAFMKSVNGTITIEDLRGYKVKEREALRGSYRGYEIVTAPPPSSGGVAMLEMLNILEPIPLKDSGPLSAKSIHWVTEAMRRAFADRAEFMGDPDFNKNLPVRGLIDKKYADKLRASIDPDKASTSQSVRAGSPAPYESMETTHYTVIDKDGTAVSVTYTLNGGYGSGVTVPGLGFLLNNEMDDFTVKPGAPNAYGLLQSEANTIAPGKTPLSAMTPTVITKDGKLLLVLGSPGGPTIINTVMNTIINFLDFGMTVQQAVDAPRFHHQWMPDRLVMENGFSPDTIAALKARGHNVDTGRGAIGDCHAIAVDPKTGELLGAADPRQGGKAVGY